MKFIFFSSLFLWIFTINSSGGILPENAFSDDAKGSATATFLKNLPSARFSAIGQTGSTVEDIENIFYNPAGMNFASYLRGFVLSHQRLLENSAKTDVAYIFRSEKYRYGFAITYNSYGSFQKINSKGELSGSFSPYDYAFIYGFSGDKKNISYGLNTKFIQTDLIYEKGYSFAIDLGVFVHPNRQDKKAYSFLVRNLGLPMKLGNKTCPLPLELIGGIKIPYSYNFSLFLEGKLPIDDNPYLSGGIEWTLPFESFQFNLRSGANTKKKNGLGFIYGFSAGFGVNIGGAVLDYAYLPYGDLGDAHKFTFSYLFGRFKKNKTGNEFAEQVRENFLKNKKFAIIDFDSRNISKSYGSLLASNIEDTIVTRNYKVISRSDMEFIRLSAGKEFLDDFSVSDFCMKLRADYCIYGSVYRSKKGVLYDVKIRDINGGYLTKSFTLNFQDEYKLKDIAIKIVDECFKE